MIWHNMPIGDVVKELKSNADVGISQWAAKERLGEYGKNILDQHKKKSMVMQFLEQLKDYMVIILLIAAAISLAVSILDGHADFIDPAIILFIVMLNATMGVIQENKAEKALDSLRKMLSPSVHVKRDDSILSIPSEELVPGDIMLLSGGDVAPADGRLLKSSTLMVDESALTGESVAVLKEVRDHLPKDLPVGDISNMIFSSTLITSGSGEAIVVDTGMHTKVGQIAKLIITEQAPKTPLQHKLAKTGETLGTGALIICGLVFCVGLLRHIPAFDMFMTSVSLAVAAIPEGLPAIVTIMLALGVQKMVKQNAIVRKLPAVETLGSASVICSDKTGTLTQNKMTVIEYTSLATLSLGSLCNNQGDPTETAIVQMAEKNNIYKQILDKSFPRVIELPFDSSRKMMTTLHKNGPKWRAITKGAPDILVEKCNLTMTQKEQILKENSQMAQKALRVIGVAYAEFDFLPSKDALEKNLTYAGLIGMIDPPRPEVAQAILTCRQAGIKVAMITGDHLETAVAIAKEIGIFQKSSKAISGKELASISDDELSKNISHYCVFARVSPKDKVRIVKAFQSKGLVVAMTGDGVNDAPALKAADIGCAMGVSGTEVAKDAADMVLTDDNFATIVSAIREGRGIYANIRKAVHFLLSCNIGEIFTIFVALLLGWATPLIAIHLLWVNLVTDSLPALALGFDRPDDHMMKEKPVNRNKGFFSDGLSFTILIEGMMIGILSLSAFRLGSQGFGDITVGRTMAFAVLSLSQLVHAFNVRSTHSLFSIGIFSNLHLVGAFLICSALQVVVITTPFLANLFKVIPLTSFQWLAVAVLSLLPLLFVELTKLFSRA